VNYHAGNEHFRALVRKHKVAYVACPKPQKGKFSRMIVDEIRARNPPGRFLKQDASTKLWEDIGEKKALDKTRQALREGAPEISKELTGDDEVGGGLMPGAVGMQNSVQVVRTRRNPTISRGTRNSTTNISLLLSFQWSLLSSFLLSPCALTTTILSLSYYLTIYQSVRAAVAASMD